MTSTVMMKAVQIHDYGGPEKLFFESVPRPEPRPGQVLIRVMATGVHPVDCKLRSGSYKAYMPLQFPWIPGRDGAGVVESVGDGVTVFKKGQAVYGFFDRSYAEYALAQVTDLAPKPEDLTFDQAAAVPVGALTAWKSVVEVAGVKQGQKVLVQGAAGGVGLYAAQLAVWKGAHVIGTASARNTDFVLSLGVEQVVDYQAVPFETVIHDVDVVVDTVGGEVGERSLLTLRKDGLLVTVAGRPAEEKAKQLGVRAVSGGRSNPDALREVTALIDAKRIRPVVGAVFSLAEAAKAQAQSDTGHGWGRIILHVADQ
jgi:NADPH:quinone reductase-like Zn-dependent oxidoreductase